MSEYQERKDEKNKSDRQREKNDQLGDDRKENLPSEMDKGSSPYVDNVSDMDDYTLTSRNESSCEASSHVSVVDKKSKSCSEVEQPQSDKWQESSGSTAETLDEAVGKSTGLIENQSFAQHLFLTPNISGSSTEPGEQLSVSSEGASGRSDEIIPDFNNVSRPESLSLKSSKSEKECSESDFLPTYPETENADVGASAQPKVERMGALSQQLRDAEYSSLSKSLPQGTITRKGDMIEFVASNLQEKIKLSSPLSQPETASSGSRRSSIKSYASASSSTSFATSSGLSQSPSSMCQQSPDDIPPIDAAAVVELENHAVRVADSLDLMMGNIRNNLHKMSAITIGCQEAYKRSVDITCDSVDASIKTMYALMAKCEELSASMGPVQQLAFQIKEIKRVLDLFESQLTDK